MSRLNPLLQKEIPEILTLEETAAMLGKTHWALRKFRQRNGGWGSLPIWRSGDSPRSPWCSYRHEIESWIQAHKEVA